MGKNEDTSLRKLTKAKGPIKLSEPEESTLHILEVDSAPEGQAVHYWTNQWNHPLGGSYSHTEALNIALAYKNAHTTDSGLWSSTGATPKYDPITALYGFCDKVFTTILSHTANPILDSNGNVTGWVPVVVCSGKWWVRDPSP